MMKFVSYDGNETTVLYDPKKDIFMINGVLYSAGVFTMFGIHGAPVGALIKVVSRDSDGSLDFTRVEENYNVKELQKQKR